MIGSLIGGILANKYGRRISNTIGCGLCLFGALCSTFAPEIWIFLIARVFLGAGIGITAVVCPMYVSEMAPPDKRGALGVLFQLAVTLGIFISFLIGWGITSIVSLSPFYKWRIQIGLGIFLPIILLALTVMRMLEPSSWTELQAKQRGSANHEEVKKKAALSEICRQKHLRQLLVTLTVLASILQLTGINAVMYYGPAILVTAGVSDANALNIGIGAWNFATTLIAIFLVDRWGRRPLMLSGVALMSVALVVIGVVYQLADLTPTARIAGVGVGLAAFIAGFEVGPGCLFWVLINELFPEEYIEFGGSYANILQWGFNLFVSTIFPFLGKSALGTPGTFYLFGAVGFVCLAYCFFFLDETKADREGEYQSSA